VNDIHSVHADSEMISGYVAGMLPPEIVADLEIHILECGECLEAVKTASAIAAALRHSPSGTASTPRMRGRRVLMIGGLLAAAATVGFVMWPRSAWSNLSAISPPAFEPFAVRGPATGDAGAATAGMDAYVRGDYATASEQLQASAERVPAPGTFFFLGIARLMLNDPERASESLTAALRPDGNPYGAEARFYLAKAFLRRGRADSALVHLRVVASGGSPLASHARALVDSVQSQIQP
jgi:hypothetical protein